MTTLHEHPLDEPKAEIHGSRILVISERRTDAAAVGDLFLATEFGGVVETADRREAIATVRAFRPDLVLLDLTAGDPEDLQLVRMVRAATSGGTFLPLLVAGHITRPWRPAVLAAGADDVVLKPLVSEELLARARNLLVTRSLYRRQAELPGHATELPAAGSAPGEEHFLKAMANSLEEAVLACDEDGQMRFVNTAAVRLGLGTLQRATLAPGRLRSAEGRELTIDEDPLHRAWATHAAVDQELTLGTVERGVRTLLATARPIVIESHRRLGAVVALRDITDRRRVTDELRRGLLQDELTGLPNAVLFLDLAGQAVARTARDHRPLSLIVIFLAGVEEERDHDVSGGPLPFYPILAALADRLPGLLRPGDTAARFGDGFALLCDAPVVESDAHQIVDRLRASLSRPLQISRGTVTPHLRFGVATTYDANLSAQRLAEIAIASASRGTPPADAQAGELVPERARTGW
jgi:PleD family two-component response regulator